MRGTMKAEWLREGDLVTFQDGSRATIDELPYLSSTGAIRARVVSPGGKTLEAGWYSGQHVVVETTEAGRRWLMIYPDEEKA